MASKKKFQDDILKCVFCCDIFAAESGLSRHKKRCKEKQKLTCELKKEKDNRILLESNIKQLENKIKQFEFKEEKLENKINKFEQKEEIYIKQNKDALVVSKNKHTCSFCDNIFTFSSNLSKHLKTCGKKNEYEEKISELTKIINQKTNDYEQKIIELNKIIEQLTKDKETFANLATTNSETSKASISTLKYLMTHYNEAPILETIEDFTNINKYNNNTSFVLQLISEYRNDHLASSIGDYISSIYKKEENIQQSIWNSDVDRLTFIIRNAVNDTKSVWLADKKGLIVGERVIKPILTFIKPLIQMFITGCLNSMDFSDTNQSKINELLESQKLANQILVLIDNLVLEKDILKHIAPIFYWNKDNTIEYKNDDEDELIETNEDIDNDTNIKVAKTSKPPNKVKIFKPPKIIKSSKSTKNNK